MDIMKNIKINIIGTIFIFLIGFILHNLYDIIPTPITAIIFPISESIFEHVKLIFTSYILWIIVKNSINKHYNIKENNYLFKELLTTIIEIVLFLLIFIPAYKTFGENLILTLLIYFITIVITQIINHFITFKNDHKYLKIISTIVIILTYIIFAYLTYKPPINDFFLDPRNNSYGLNK